MIREAVEALGSPTTNVAVKEWIHSRYPGTNPSTVQQHLMYCSVNQPSRVHQGFNKRPRTADDPRYDFLYTPGRGLVEMYDPERHGVWAIERDATGSLTIRRVGGASANRTSQVVDSNTRPDASRHVAPRTPATASTKDDAAELEIVEPPSLALAWCEWRPLTQKGKGCSPGAPERPGVYQVRCECGDGKCEIVYIGLSARGAKGLRGRIDNHRSKPGQCADNLVNARRFWDLAEEPIEIRWAVTEDSHYAEAVLLRQFKDQHGRLPRFNTDG
jgi:hypothetical protein